MPRADRWPAIAIVAEAGAASVPLPGFGEGNFAGSWVRVDVHVRSGRLRSVPSLAFPGAADPVLRKAALALVLSGSARTVIRVPDDASRSNICFEPPIAEIENIEVTFRRVWLPVAALTILSAVAGSIGLKDLPAVARRVGAALRLGRFRGLKQLVVLAYRSRVLRPQDYRLWLSFFESPSTAGVDRVSTAAAPPVFSVVLVGSPESAERARASVQSVAAQAGHGWEICLALPAARQAMIAETVALAGIPETGIRVSLMPAGCSTGEMAAAALRATRGELVCFLEWGDRLAFGALAAIASAASANPAIEFFYSDEDRIDDDGARSAPLFKPAFSLESAWSHDLLCRLACMRRSALDRVASEAGALSGDAVFELALRVIERPDGPRVLHVPRVLYHSRGAGLPGAMSDGALAALSNHLERIGLRGARVERNSEYPRSARIRFRVPLPAPSVTIVIPTRDRLDLLRRSVGSVLAKSSYPAFGITIVDNASRDPATLEYLRELPRNRVTVIRDERPFNFSALNNGAVRACESDFVCFLNNDVEVLGGDWLEELVSHAVRPGVGAVGARLWYPDFTLQHGGVVLGMSGAAGHLQRGLARRSAGYAGRAAFLQCYSAVTGACLLLRRDLFIGLGGFDELLAVEFNDIDLCLRIGAAGLRIVWTPFAELMHHESASRGRAGNAQSGREHALFCSRWEARLESDPCYSPNLSLDSEAVELAWPPRGVAPR